MENEKLIKVIEQLKEVRTATKSKVSDETIFDAGVRIYNSEQIELHKSYGRGTSSFHQTETNQVTSIAAPAPTPQDKEPATSNQIVALKRHGYTGDTSKLTKYEAWVLIKEGKRGWKKR